MSCLVFAYGSNMCRERMRNRVSSAVFVGVAVLQYHELLFNKRGVDGSAKANAFYTGNECDTIWGAVFKIDVQHKPTLDAHEFIGIGYDAVTANVQMSDGSSLSVWTYVALATAIEDGLRPFTWYKGFVLRGARQHGLPTEYVRFLESFDSVPDPDVARRRTNERLLGS